MPTRVRLAALVLLGVLAAGRASAAPGALVATGDVSPLDLPFSRFSDVALDDRGRVAFVGGSTGVFRRVGDGLARIVVAGDPLDGHVVAGVGAATTGAGDCLVVQTTFVGGGGGVYRRCGGAPFEAVARIGDGAPAGGTFAAFTPTVAVGSSGHAAFAALLDDGASAVFVVEPGSGGAVHEVARVGAPSPGGGTFSAIHLVGVSAQGRVGFRGIVSNGPDGLFDGDGSAVRKIAVVNDATVAGGQFTAFGLASLNAFDAWAFRATVVGPGFGGTAVDGIFRGDASSVVPLFDTVALEGDPSPLAGTLRDIPSSTVPAINDAGAVVFRSTLADAQKSAAILMAPAGGGPLVAVVAVGDEFSDQVTLRRLREAVVAEDGSVLVRATLSSGTPGLFAVRAGALTPVALLGETTDVGSGFRFADPSVTGTAEDGIFLGFQEGLYVVGAPNVIQLVAALGDPTALGGTFAGFGTPVAGPGGQIVFAASVQGGRANEAIFAVRGRRAKPVVVGGRRVPLGKASIIDLFPDTVDSLERPGVGPGGIAFPAALGHSKVNVALFMAGAGGIRTLVRAGDRAAGGGTYAAFGTPAVGRGTVGFVAQVSGGRGRLGLFLRQGKKTRALGILGRDTKTRLTGTFGGFDAPAAAGRALTFRARLSSPGVEGVFLDDDKTLVALAGTGDPAPDGGRFRSFGDPVLAGDSVVFGADVAGGTAAAGFYRVRTADALADPTVVPPTDAVALVGDASPRGGTFLAFGAPVGNAKGALAYTADLSGASASSGIFFQPDLLRAQP